MLILPVAAAAQWIALASPTGDTLRSVHFLDANLGWVAGYNGVVRRTTNGGIDWSPQVSGTSVRLLSIRFVDANNGWINGGLYVARTVNGGAGWTPITTDPSALIFRNNGFPSSSNVYWVPAACGTCSTRWFYRYTVDGTGSSVEQTFDLTMSSAPFLDVQFIDADNGWAVGFSALIRRITAASSATPGFAFQTCTGCAGATLNAVFMLDAVRGWIVGNTGTIRATVDGGTTWTQQSGNTSANLRDVHFRDALNGWIVGDGGLILGTVDGGVVWTPENSTVGTTLFGTSAQAGPVYAVGGDLANSTNGIALKRPDVLLADSFE